MEDIFQDILKASATGASNFLRDGKYILTPTNIELKITPVKGLTWIAKFMVLASAPVNEYHLLGEPVVVGTPDATLVLPNAVGEEVSWNIPKTNMNFAPNIKNFLLAFTNTTEQAFNEENKAAAAAGKDMPGDVLTKAMIGPNQVSRGYLIGVNTFRKENQGRQNKGNEGKLMVLPNWRHIAKCGPGMTNEQGDDEAAARRKVIEAGQVPALPAWLQIPGLTQVAQAA